MVCENIFSTGSESDQPKRKRGKKTIGTRKEKRKGAVETLKGKQVKSKETISTSESDSDSAGGLKIASGWAYSVFGLKVKEDSNLN